MLVALAIARVLRPNASARFGEEAGRRATPGALHRRRVGSRPSASSRLRRIRRTNLSDAPRSFGNRNIGIVGRAEQWKRPQRLVGVTCGSCGTSGLPANGNIVGDGSHGLRRARWRGAGTSAMASVVGSVQTSASNGHHVVVGGHQRRSELSSTFVCSLTSCRGFCVAQLRLQVRDVIEDRFIVLIEQITGNSRCLGSACGGRCARPNSSHSGPSTASVVWSGAGAGGFGGVGAFRR